MTGLLASIVEAYGELRVHKGRILLSLIGVAFSVFALTAVMGAGGMLTSALVQSTESWAGRDTTVTVYPMDSAAGATAEDVDAVVLEQVDRLGIDQRSRRIYDAVRVQTAQGVRTVEMQGVDPAFGTIYRTQVEQGRWLADSDASRLSPALVVNQPMYELLGSPDLGTETVTLFGPTGATHSEQAIIVHVRRRTRTWTGRRRRTCTPPRSAPCRDGSWRRPPPTTRCGCRRSRPRRSVPTSPPRSPGPRPAPSTCRSPR